MEQGAPKAPAYPLAVADNLEVKGFVNSHSHAFQRAMRGRNEGEGLLGLAGHDAGAG